MQRLRRLRRRARCWGWQAMRWQCAVGAAWCSSFSCSVSAAGRYPRARSSTRRAPMRRWCCSERAGAQHARAGRHRHGRRSRIACLVLCEAAARQKRPATRVAGAWRPFPVRAIHAARCAGTCASHRPLNHCSSPDRTCTRWCARCSARRSIRWNIPVHPRQAWSTSRWMRPGRWVRAAQAASSMHCCDVSCANAKPSWRTWMAASRAGLHIRAGCCAASAQRGRIRQTRSSRPTTNRHR